MFLFRMAGRGRDLFYPPSGSIILYVCKRVIKDPATKTRVKKDPGQRIKIPDPKVQICDFHNTFGTGKWKFAFCLGMFADSSASIFYLIAFLVRVVQIDIAGDVCLNQ